MGSRFEDDGVAGNQSGGGIGNSESERVVPWSNDADYPHRKKSGARSREEGKRSKTHSVTQNSFTFPRDEADVLGDVQQFLECVLSGFPGFPLDDVQDFFLVAPHECFEFAQRQGAHEDTLRGPVFLGVFRRRKQLAQVLGRGFFGRGQRQSRERGDPWAAFGLGGEPSV